MRTVTVTLELHMQASTMFYGGANLEAEIRSALEEGINDKTLFNGVDVSDEIKEKLEKEDIDHLLKYCTYDKEQIRVSNTEYESDGDMTIIYSVPVFINLDILSWYRV